MSEIYWLTRLDGVCSFLNFVSAICIICIAACIFVWLSTIEKNTDEETEIHTKSTKKLKTFIITFILSIGINTFIPTTKEAMAIWGIGGTIDYIKSNDTVKQIPDKCIKALDKFVDKYTKE